MNKKEALELSIKKWKDIINKNGNDEGPDNCALCQKYFFKEGIKSCMGCPVEKRTKKLCCDGTPYEEWDEHQDTEHEDDSNERKIYCKECGEIALKELKFLKSLRKDIKVKSKRKSTKTKKLK